MAGLRKLRPSTMKQRKQQGQAPKKYKTVYKWVKDGDGIVLTKIKRRIKEIKKKDKLNLNSASNKMKQGQAADSSPPKRFHFRQMKVSPKKYKTLYYSQKEVSPNKWRTEVKTKDGDGIVLTSIKRRLIEIKKRDKLNSASNKMKQTNIFGETPTKAGYKFPRARIKKHKRDDLLKLPQWSRSNTNWDAIMQKAGPDGELYVRKPKCLMCTFLTNSKNELRSKNRRQERKIEDLRSEIRKMRTRCALNEHCIKCLKEPTYTFFIRSQITKIESQLKNLTNVLTGDKAISRCDSRRFFLRRRF